MGIKQGLAIAVLLFSCTAAKADWVDDWFDQSVTGGASHYESQKRGYYTGGSFQGRFRFSNDYVVSAQAPRIKVGCGGIDLFSGGFSYLDGEYLVEKAERVIQAAPAFAFDLALQEYCKPCLSAMTKLQEITDHLNSMQMNDCQMSKRLVAISHEGIKDAFAGDKSAAASEQSIGTGQRKNSQDFREDTMAGGGIPPDQTEDLLADCPQPFLDIFTNGSVVEAVTTKLGLDDYASVMRGLIGDVNVSYDNSARAYTTEVVSHCEGNDQTQPVDFLSGQMEVKNLAGACVPSADRAITSIVRDRLNSVAAKIKAGAGNYTAAEESFIAASTTLSLLPVLRDAVGRGTEAEAVDRLTTPLSLVYAHRVLDDLYKGTELALRKAKEVQQKAVVRPGGNIARCNTAFLLPAIKHVSGMVDRSSKYRSLANANYRLQQQDIQTSMSIATDLYSQRKKALRQLNAATRSN